ncbi:MAG: hypothetical protein J6M12_08435, partial [Clostridia bacterium]|nr:hypothetical protein [Clostridia bacterium]
RPKFLEIQKPFYKKVFGGFLRQSLRRVWGVSKKRPQKTQSPKSIPRAPAAGRWRDSFSPQGGVGEKGKCGGFQNPQI